MNVYESQTSFIEGSYFHVFMKTELLLYFHCLYTEYYLIHDPDLCITCKLRVLDLFIRFMKGIFIFCTGPE